MTNYLSFHEMFFIVLCDSFVFFRMKSLRVKGVVRVASHISEAMTRFLQRINEVLVESFIHFMEYT